MSDELQFFIMLFTTLIIDQLMNSDDAIHLITYYYVIIGTCSARKSGALTNRVPAFSTVSVPVYVP